MPSFNYHKFRPQSDYWLGLTVLILVLLGLVMISSASVVISFEKYGYNTFFLKKQFWSLLVGVAVWLITLNIDYRFWKKWANWMLLLTLILLVAVFIPGIGKTLAGAQRWIHIGPLFFQPSEVVKLTFLIYLAAWLEKKGEGVKDFSTGVLPFLVIVGVIAFLILKQPDMGTMMVVAASAAIVFFVSGASRAHLFGILSGAAALILLMIKMAPYRLQRLAVFLNPTSETQGAAYHINQALLAIGSGGFWGLGFGQSRQKYLYLPQSYTDSIFAIIAEEMGFGRTILILLLFVFLGLRGFGIAKKAPDDFAKFLAVGITSWFLFQAFVNIAAMLGLLPLTGIPLPFISYGGSSLVISLAAVGILMNISKSTQQ